MLNVILRLAEVDAYTFIFEKRGVVANLTEGGLGTGFSI